MRRLTAAAVLALAALACDESLLKRPGSSSDTFEMKQDKDGRTVRLNRNTGEMTVLEGTVLVPVKTPEDAARDASAARLLAEAKDWPPVELIGKDTTTYLKTSWRDGQLFYQFWVRATPRIKTLRARSPFGRYFQAQLVDAQGFNVISIRVPLNEFTGSVNDTGEVEWFSANASIPCSDDTYRSAASWTVEWNL